MWFLYDMCSWFRKVNTWKFVDEKQWNLLFTLLHRLITIYSINFQIIYLETYSALSMIDDMITFFPNFIQQNLIRVLIHWIISFRAIQQNLWLHYKIWWIGENFAKNVISYLHKIALIMQHRFHNSRKHLKDPHHAIKHFISQLL